MDPCIFMNKRKRKKERESAKLIFYDVHLIIRTEGETQQVEKLLEAGGILVT